MAARRPAPPPPTTSTSLEKTSIWGPGFLGRTLRCGPHRRQTRATRATRQDLESEVPGRADVVGLAVVSVPAPHVLRDRPEDVDAAHGIRQASSDLPVFRPQQP